MQMLVAGTQGNSEVLNTARHQDPGEFLTVMLQTTREEMKSDKEVGRMMVGVGATFGRLFTVVAVQCKWCRLTEVSRPSRANFRIIGMLLFPLQIIFIDSYVTTTTYK